MRSHAKRGSRRPGFPWPIGGGLRPAQRARIRTETITRQAAEQELERGRPFNGRLEEDEAIKLFKLLPEVRVSA